MTPFDRRNHAVLAVVWMTVILASPAVAHAHTLSRSSSQWDFRGEQVIATVSVPWIEILRRRSDVEIGSASTLTLTPALSAWLGSVVTAGFEMGESSDRCAVDEPATLAPGPTREVLVRFSARCEREPYPRVRANLFFDDGLPHLHFIRVQRGSRSVESLLTADQRTVDLLPAASAGRRFTSSAFILTGVQHVIDGADHLAFVLGIVLLGGGLWTIARAVSGFTLGHALALCFFALGWVRPAPLEVELLVALSVAFIGLEHFSRSAALSVVLLANGLLHAGVLLAAFTLGSAPVLLVTGSAILTTSALVLRAREAEPAWLPTALPTVFGVVHGLAFASVLQTLLPAGASNGWTLVGFNLGVEVAQIGVAVVATVTLALAAGASQTAKAWLVPCAAAAVCALGAYWSWVRAAG